MTGRDRPSGAPCTTCAEAASPRGRPGKARDCLQSAWKSQAGVQLGAAPLSVGVSCPLLDCSGGNTFPAGNKMEQKCLVARTAQHPVAFLRPPRAGSAMGQADSSRTPASLTSRGRALVLPGQGVVPAGVPSSQPGQHMRRSGAPGGKEPPWT